MEATWGGRGVEVVHSVMKSPVCNCFGGCGWVVEEEDDCSIRRVKKSEHRGWRKGIHVYTHMYIHVHVHTYNS